MKLRIIHEGDTVYTDRGNYLYITMEIWWAWDKEVNARIQRQIGTTPFVGVYDTAECAECGVISRRHLRALVEWMTINKIDTKGIRITINKNQCPKEDISKT